jgi:hypothetical protein
MKFRKKPVVIEAMRFRAGMTLDEVTEFVTCDVSGHGPGDSEVLDGLDIETLEGDLHVSDGDWIIRGVKGEFYPCKPDIFEATYDRVDDADSVSEVPV